MHVVLRQPCSKHCCSPPCPAPSNPAPRSLRSCGGEVLLLQRTSKNNFGTWGLPGGNADDTDADLLEVATREAKEEMGEQLPRFQVVESVLTKRGKRWAGAEGETHMGRHWGSSAAACMLGLVASTLCTHGWACRQHAVRPAVQNGQHANSAGCGPVRPLFQLGTKRLHAPLTNYPMQGPEAVQRVCGED